LLSERRDKPAARRFFRRANGTNDVPDLIIFNKSSAKLAGLEAAHMIHKGQFDANGLNAIQQFARLAA
jgi:putative transposase